MDYKPTEEEVEDFLRRNVYVTDEQIEEANNCQQRSQKWDEYRKHRIGMSMVGSAIPGHNPYRTPRQLLKDMLWPSFQGNRNTEYGTIMEDTGVKIAEMQIKHHLRAEYGEVWIEQTGTRIWKEHPWLSASSDGLIFAAGGPPDRPAIYGTLEHKCPSNKQYYRQTPQYHYDQFTGAAVILGVDFIVYSVYTPLASQINYFQKDMDYWDNVLFPELKKFYFEQYIPRAILKERNRLKPGEIDLVAVIHLPLPVLTKDKDEENVSSDIEEAEEAEGV
jgi:hypothetical protein